MKYIRHAPDPTHGRQSLCGFALKVDSGVSHELASVGHMITCHTCQRVIDFAMKCVSPTRYILVRTP